MSTTSQRPSIYEMVLSGAGSTTVERIRYRIADEASADPDWRVLYDEVLDQDLPMPELTAPTHPPQHTPGRAFIGFGSGPEQRAALLWARMVQLGEDTRLPDDVDLVAAVGAAEIWLAATGSENFNCAVSFGCDAINSLSAILARSVGEGLAPIPAARCTPEGPADVTTVTAAVTAVRRWTEQTLGAGSWPEVRSLIVADLGWSAVGGSLTAHAAQITATN